jgi:hypothetical protein
MVPVNLKQVRRVRNAPPMMLEKYVAEYGGFGRAIAFLNSRVRFSAAIASVVGVSFSS